MLLGYLGPFSNQWKVQNLTTKRVVHSIHVDWNEESFGLDKALSADHLEATMEEAGVDSSNLN